ncbi:MAG: PAS-domain containing protein [Rubellimicrobium sp.]|nr:PAS-domain containing protein [Rubellimicrobium sp.]
MTIDMLVRLGVLLGFSVAGAAVVLALLSRLFERASAPAAQAGADLRPAVLVFEDGMLCDPTDEAQRLLRHQSLAENDLAAVVANLSRSFPDLGDRLNTLGQDGSLRIPGITPGAQIRVDAWDGFLRLEICDQRGTVDDPIFALERDALEDEVETLRSIAEDAPQPIWKVDARGDLVWANRAYLGLADKLRPTEAGHDPLWPGTAVFADLQPLPDCRDSLVQRAALHLPDASSPLWFEVTTVRRGTALVHFAVDATGMIAAEAGRQTFIQTLTKTFAHLPIGLAIFDRDRRLALFNPAFLDLTGLPVTFLSSRPQVHTFLDRLRDRNMLPEPKNYTTWRDQVAALEAAAIEGTYCETWTLPGGQVYRVSGRPHPDGAIAFLFEDISEEVMLTRHFRSELNTAQAVIDTLDEGLAVFSQGGTLTMTNAAYHRIWAAAPPRPETAPDIPSAEATLALTDTGLSDEVARWAASTLPSPLLGKLADGLPGGPGRGAMAEVIRLNDGRALVCRVEALSRGAFLVGFRLTIQPDTRTEPLLQDAEPVVSTVRRRERRQARAIG